MSNIPADLKFARSHEWIRQLGDGTAEVGISDHAQHALGDLVFVELPDIGRALSAGEACAVVESVKAASDVFAPVAGTVVAVNDQLRHTPELINRDPYGGGWLLRLRAQPSSADTGLLSAGEYGTLTAEG
ncbi:MAG TPA: glycine cleavage system protein GcvH [Steroidobacteraceae bacterium]|jgi:glycine cleavage system H protein|nr:glycine cleavage system protein GcvH [Steroidobacteraceae bacterium]